MKKHELSSNTIATISSIVILLGLFIFSSNYLNKKKILAYDYMSEVMQTKKEIQNSEELTAILEKKEENTQNHIENKTSYE